MRDHAYKSYILKRSNILNIEKKLLQCNKRSILTKNKESTEHTFLKEDW